MKVLVTGVSGFVGGELAARLIDDGHDVRGLSRDPSAVDLDIPVIRGDAASGSGLARALEGVDLSYYLIHSLESGNREAFPAKDLRAVKNFVREAERANLGRVAFLGTNHPRAEGPLSAHLESRFDVEAQLLQSSIEAVSMRANFIVSARNPQFRHLVGLLTELPTLVLPPWHRAKLAPLDSRDVISSLVAAATLPAVGDCTYEIGGEQMTAGEMMTRLAALMGLERDILELDVPLDQTSAESVASLTGADPALIGPLMQTACYDLVPRTNDLSSLGVANVTPFDEAVRRALGAMTPSA